MEYCLLVIAALLMDIIVPVGVNGISNACSCTKFFNNFKFIECVIFDASLTLHFLAAKLLYSTLCVSLSVNPLFYFYPINKCYKVNRENGVKNVKNL